MGSQKLSFLFAGIIVILALSAGAADDGLILPEETREAMKKVKLIPDLIREANEAEAKAKAKAKTEVDPIEAAFRKATKDVSRDPVQDALRKAAARYQDDPVSAALLKAADPKNTDPVSEALRKAAAEVLKKQTRPDLRDEEYYKVRVR